MSKYFVPYQDDHPAFVEIKGHRVLIVTPRQEEMVVDLPMIGGTTVREVETESDSPVELAHLADTIQAGIVIAPPGVRLGEIVFSLHAELPWLH